jgi:RNase P/RNase MRP subunit POP5
LQRRALDEMHGSVGLAIGPHRLFVAANRQGHGILPVPDIR